MSEKVQTGLEAPPSYFMELWRYRELHGEPDAKKIIYELIDNVKTPGVEVEDADLRGMHKRIRRSMVEASKTASLHEAGLLLDKDAPKAIFDEARKQLSRSAAVVPSTQVRLHGAGGPAAVSEHEPETKAAQCEGEGASALAGGDVLDPGSDDDDIDELTALIASFAPRKAQANKPDTAPKPKAASGKAKARVSSAAGGSVKSDSASAAAAAAPKSKRKPERDLFDDNSQSQPLGLRKRGRKQADQMETEDMAALNSWLGLVSRCRCCKT